MKELSILIVALAVIGLIVGCRAAGRENAGRGGRGEAFIRSHVAQIRPLAKAAALANWDAANSGDAADYDRFSELQLEIRQIYSNTGDFALLKEIRQGGVSGDALEARQIKALYNAYLSNQIEPKLLRRMVELSTRIEKNFSTFRGKIGGEDVTSNEIREILKDETKTAKRKKAWLASKQVGPVVADDIIALVKMRNEGARGVGFDNFHSMKLTVGEQDVDQLDKVFAQLDELTAEPFARLKTKLDGILADSYGTDAQKLMPWHYHDPFFQEAPMVYDVSLDTYYEGRDIEELTRAFFNGIGLSVDDVLDNSDLYERDKKNPHAFCTDIDKEGDVRILCNIKDNEQWMGTTLHECGHVVYDKFHDRQVPYLLRRPAHIFTTEAIAMLFGRLSGNGAWMEEMLDLSKRQRAKVDKVSGDYARLRQLIFVRWVLVMYNFEKALYRNPDGDLNSLWWEMAEKYQLVNRPPSRNEPDWAAKIHFAIAPCYYHNYMLGELLASQLHHHIVKNVLKADSDADVSYVSDPRVGDYLRENIFEVGSVYHWNEMIQRATGRELTPKYFADQFVK